MEFKWDKSVFGEVAPEVEKVIEQSMAYATKNKATELESKFETTKKELEDKLKSYQEKVLNMELNTVDESNKKVVMALLKDTNNIDEIKETYPHLFKQNVISAEDVLNKTQMEFTDEEARVLEKEKSMQPLTDEEKVIWSRAIIKSQNT